MYEYRIEITKGHDKGSVYKINGADITIGRDPSNDIVLSDKKITLYHAKLVYTGQSYIVEIVDQDARVSVNGRLVSRQQLSSGDIVSLNGVYEFKFIIIKETQDKPPSFVPSDIEIPTAKKKSPKLKIMIIASVVLLGALYLMPEDNTGSQVKKKNETAEVKDDDKSDFEKLITSDIEYKDKVPEGMEALFEKADNMYKRGRREFDLENYVRALEYFKRALSFYPSHGLARRYAKLSMDMIYNNAKQQLVLGKKLMSQFKYEEALRNFLSVLELLKDREKTKVYKEADKMRKIAEKYLEDFE